MNVVITGATRGIGRAIAERFAAEGHSIVACARTIKELFEMKNDFLNRFPSVSITVFAADMGDVMQVKNFGKQILDAGITVDILVNNAGYFTPGSVYNENENTIEKMMEVNVYSVYHLTRALLPEMMTKGQGHIFNICSVASFTPFNNVGSYGISKYALYGLTKNLREEMKPFGIKVTAVCPGATFTSSWEGAGIEQGRLVEAADIAEMVVAAAKLSSGAAVEDIVIRPQLGDL